MTPGTCRVTASAFTTSTRMSSPSSRAIFAAAARMLPTHASPPRFRSMTMQSHRFARYRFTTSSPHSSQA
jgi:hypothetical protein